VLLKIIVLPAYNICYLCFRSALQTLHKVSSKARENNYFLGGLTHDWATYYEQRVDSERSCLNEWHAMDSLESKRPPSPNSLRSKWVNSSLLYKDDCPCNKRFLILLVNFYLNYFFRVLLCLRFHLFWKFKKKLQWV
jgi:hypothetical protein